MPHANVYAPAPTPIPERAIVYAPAGGEGKNTRLAGEPKGQVLPLITVDCATGNKPPCPPTREPRAMQAPEKMRSEEACKPETGSRVARVHVSA